MEAAAASWAIAVLWLYSVFTIFWLSQWWLGRHIQGLALLVSGRPHFSANLYFFLIAPGVILHELSHWLVAKLLFVPTRDLVLFRPQPSRERRSQGGPITLGYVEIFKTDPLRQSLIGLAPLPVGITVLLILAALLRVNAGLNPATPEIWQTLSQIPPKLANSFSQPINLLWLYLVFSVSTGMLPSRPDRRPWLVGFVLPGGVLLLLALTGQLPPLPVDWLQGLRQFIINLTWLFGFAAFINLGLAGCIFLLEEIISRLARRRVVYK